MKILVMDTETTGLSPRYNKILTIGLLPVFVNKEKLDILGSKHILVKHNTYNADPMALAVNKINLTEHTKKAVEPKHACKEINTFIQQLQLEKTPVMGHNLAFDKGFIQTLFEKEEQTHKLHKETIDTMHLWRRLKNKGTIPYNLRSNLSTVANYFNIDSSKAHDAIEDCHLTAQIYQKMLKLL